MDAPMCQNFPSCGKRHYGECGGEQTSRAKQPAGKEKSKPKLASAKIMKLKSDNSNIAALVDQMIHESLTTEGEKVVEESVPGWKRFEEFLARIESLESRVEQLEARKKYQRDLMRKRREEGKA